MKEKGNAISLLIGLGLIVIYFLIKLPFAIPSVFITVAYWVTVAVFVTVPLATFFSEKLLAPLIGDRGAKIARDYSRAKGLGGRS